jgi:inorganic pyrophosphatase
MALTEKWQICIKLKSTSFLISLTKNLFKQEERIISKMNNLDMIVEIPYNSFVKYEFDKDKEQMRCDRVLHTAMSYPGNYGYFPNTLAGDGDPLDVLMICDYAIYPGILVKVKIIGVLITTDEKGEDEKIIVVPSEGVDPNYTHINHYDDLPPWTLSKIRHFFEHYKDTENNKWVKVKDFRGREDAIQIYKKTVKRYKD